MRHFVSATCEGQVCLCSKPAMHKLGEEIAFDEPCNACNQTNEQFNAEGAAPCMTFYHLGMLQRNNLTAYVCCACFTRVVGLSAGCPLTVLEQRAYALYKETHRPGEWVCFEPLLGIICPRCDADLTDMGSNVTQTVRFIDCKSCGTGYEISMLTKLSPKEPLIP
jgi:hypothetical protein